MRRAGSRFAFAAVSFMRAPPFAKHSVLHAGTAKRRAGRKRKRVSIPFPPFRLFIVTSTLKSRA